MDVVNCPLLNEWCPLSLTTSLSSSSLHLSAADLYRHPAARQPEGAGGALREGADRYGGSLLALTRRPVMQVSVSSCPSSRLQRHALQEEPHARRALLQPGPTPGGAVGRPAADGLGPVAGEDAGRQRQQVDTPDTD